jgi:hypothetical protein
LPAAQRGWGRESHGSHPIQIRRAAARQCRMPGVRSIDFAI